MEKEQLEVTEIREMVILESELTSPNLLLELDQKLVQKYKFETDAELLQRVVNVADYLGHTPRKSEIVGSWYIKQRLGAWHRILEQAGMRKISKRREEKLARRKQKKNLRNLKNKKVMNQGGEQ